MELQENSAALVSNGLFLSGGEQSFILGRKGDRIARTTSRQPNASVNQCLSLRDLASFRTENCVEKRKANPAVRCGGKLCLFSHSSNWLRRNPFAFPYRPTLCPNVIFSKEHRKLRVNVYCRRGRECMFAHTKEEQMFHPLLYKTEICRVWPSCTKSFCPFAHGKVEQRNSDDAGFYPFQGPELLEPNVRAWNEAQGRMPNSCRVANALPATPNGTKSVGMGEVEVSLDSGSHNSNSSPSAYTVQEGRRPHSPTISSKSNAPHSSSDDSGTLIVSPFPSLTLGGGRMHPKAEVADNSISSTATNSSTGGLLMPFIDQKGCAATSTSSLLPLLPSLSTTTSVDTITTNGGGSGIDASFPRSLLGSRATRRLQMFLEEDRRDVPSLQPQSSCVVSSVPFPSLSQNPCHNGDGSFLLEDPVLIEEALSVHSSSGAGDVCHHCFDGGTTRHTFMASHSDPGAPHSPLSSDGSAQFVMTCRLHDDKSSGPSPALSVTENIDTSSIVRQRLVKRLHKVSLGVLVALEVIVDELVTAETARWGRGSSSQTRHSSDIEECMAEVI